MNASNPLMPSPEQIARVTADPEAMEAIAIENKRRAARMEKALTEYQDLGPQLDETTVLGDMLCNLMHFAEQNDVDWNAALQQARFHFEAEHYET
jgi:hypothetical protein